MIDDPLEGASKDPNEAPATIGAARGRSPRPVHAEGDEPGPVRYAMEGLDRLAAEPEPERIGSVGAGQAVAARDGGG